MSMYSSIKIVRSGVAQAIPLFVCFLMIFSSQFLSAARISKKKTQEVTSRSLALSDREREAVCSDLPLPAGGALQPAAVDDNEELSTGSSLTYRVKMSREDVTTFYELGMVQLGWHKIAHKRGAQDVLVYETPSKIALVSLRPDKAKKGWKRSTTLVITLQEVSKEHEAELV